MSVGSPVLLHLAIVLASVCIAAAWRRRVVALLLGSSVLTALAAAADVRIFVGRPAVIAVLVDASPSTRGLWFREADTVRQTAAEVAGRLAPGASLRYYTFAGEATAMGAEVIERNTDQTALPRVEADAVMLLSDGRLGPVESSTGPMFPIVRGDERTEDARITGIEQTSGAVTLSITNDGPPRELTWPDESRAAISHGTIRVAHTPVRGTVSLNAGDRWPENDSLDIAPPVAVASERWWIGASPAPPGFRSIDPAALPLADAFLSAKEVVLANVAAAELGADGMRALARYVRDAGGALTIGGGDRAFSAGGYGGTELDAFSPLASRPPAPRNEWLILVDSSGSMAGKTDDGRTRLETAIDAAAGVIRALPPADTIAVASFARELRRWPAIIDRQASPPRDLTAGGPTNLQTALESIIASRKDGAAVLPLHVLLISDGDAELSAGSDVAGKARDARIIIDWVRLGAELSARQQAVAELAQSTGGTITVAGDPREWCSAALGAMRAIERIAPASSPALIAWRDGHSPETASAINATWPRNEVEVLAARSDDGTSVVGRWRVGAGQVIAAAYAAPGGVLERLSASIASSPRDPRFIVEWETEQVQVDAAEAGTAVNDLSLRVIDIDTGASTALPQIAPGRYLADIAPSTTARTFALRNGGQSVDLHVVPGAAREEFRGIGVDEDALSRLAAKTGGRMIRPDALGGEPLVQPRRQVSFTPPLLLGSLLASVGAVLVGRRA